MERKKPSSKSQKKAHSSKKTAEGASRRIDGSEGKSFKRIHSSDETSSDERVSADESRIQPAGLDSRATDGESSQKETSRKLDIDRIRPSTSKSLEKEHSSKVNVKGTSRSKEKAYKKIASCEESFSEEMVNGGSSQKQPCHSRAFSEDYSHKEAPRKTDRKRPSSSKPPIKLHLTKKNGEETWYRTRSSGITCKKINYCEDSSPEESRNNAESSILSCPGASDEDNRRKDTPSSQSILPTGKGYNKQTIVNSTGSCPRIGKNTDSRNNIKDADKFFQESTCSETLPDFRDFPKSERVDPFPNLRKHYDAVRRSKSDKERETDGTEADGGAYARMAPKLAENFLVFKAIKMKQDKEKKASTSKIADAKPQPSGSFHYKRKGSFKSNTPTIDSEVGLKLNHDRTEDKDNAFEGNSPKVERNGMVNKEGEKSLSKLGKTKDETIKSKTDDAEDAGKVPPYGGLLENKTDPKFSPINTENKRGLKRRSDPGNLHKENRPPPSI